MKILILVLVLLSVELKANNLYQPGLTARCYAMGGTCSSHVQGSYALFLNPAALARTEGFDFTILNLRVAGGGSFNSATNFDSSDLDSLYGKKISIELEGKSSFAVPNFAFGLFSNNYTNLSFADPTFPTFNMRFISDYGYAVGTGFALGPSTSVGLVGRRILRWGGDLDIGVSEILGSSSNSLADEFFLDRGVGYALDVGIMTTLNNSWKPTISLNWFDVGVTTFNKSSGNNDPPRQLDNLVLGLTFNQELGPLKFTHAAEYKHATLQNIDSFKKVHFGTEMSLGLIDLRAGVNQGYVTYGVGLDLWLLEIDASAYSVEQGAYPGQDRMDLYTASITLCMDFDQSFKLRGQDGKKRRLKQRR